MNFEGETHFRCYIVSEQTPEPAETVTLTDQFQSETLTVDEPLQFCAPTSKDGAPIEKPEEHLTMYGAARELVPHLTVSTTDQFGPRTLRAVGARSLLVPTQKLVGNLQFPEELADYARRSLEKLGVTVLLGRGPIEPMGILLFVVTIGLVVITMALFYVAQRQLVSGLTAGGVKG